MFNADLFEVYRRLAQERDGVERYDLVLLVDEAAVLWPSFFKPSKEPGTLLPIQLKNHAKLSDSVFPKRVPWFLQGGPR